MAIKSAVSYSCSRAIFCVAALAVSGLTAVRILASRIFVRFIDIQSGPSTSAAVLCGKAVPHVEGIGVRLSFQATCPSETANEFDYIVNIWNPKYFPRTVDKKMLHNGNCGKGWRVSAANASRPGSEAICSHVKETWFVTTTIMEVNRAVVAVATKFPKAGVVVVGDFKSNHSMWEDFSRNFENVVYLSPDSQTELGFLSTSKLPWNHFGRKTIGYLFAIRNHANQIFDFDDDNHVVAADIRFYRDMNLSEADSRCHVVNPYPYFWPAGAAGPFSFVWPRGFPLQFISDPSTLSIKSSVSDGLRDKIAIIQSLADHDPDVDAVYRMTRDLPLRFRNRDELLVIPKGKYSPWNAQATYVNHEGFFSLLLPVTVTGRVSDIWRGYIAQRLLWETGYRLSFSSPIVTQHRNPHSYQKDLEDERDLYFKTDAFLDALSSWSSRNLDSLDVAYIDLLESLKKKDFLGPRDVELGKIWVKDLAFLGYTWPKILERVQPFKIFGRGVVDQRSIGRSADVTSQVSCVGNTECVLYLVQGPARNYTVWKERINSIGETALILYHSFDEPCQGCIFQSGTNFASGRNLLLRHALDCDLPGLKYYAFVDDDVVLSCDDFSGSCWNSWQEMLLSADNQEPFIAPKTWIDPTNESTTYQTCVDDAFWVIRQDLVHAFMPVPEYGMQDSWWHKTHVLWEICRRCFPYGFRTDHRWRISNPIHRPYPSEKVMSAVRDILEVEYNDLGPWYFIDKEAPRHRCQVSDVPVPPAGTPNKCNTVLRERFHIWLKKDGDTRSYNLFEDWRSMWPKSLSTGDAM